MSDNIKISLIGNCQTLALTWYLQQLRIDFDVKWIQFEGAENIKVAMLKDYCQDKRISIISNIHEGKRRLQDSNYIIFQHIKKERSPSYNYGQLKKYAKKAKLISISSMHYQPKDPYQKFFKGMVERAEKHNIDIPAHKIIEKHGHKIQMQSSKKWFRHPRVFYFLEVVRELCGLTGWDYYSDDQYNKYLKEGFPFG